MKREFLSEEGKNFFTNARIRAVDGVLKLRLIEWKSNILLGG